MNGALMKTLRDRTSALLLGISLCGLASLAGAAPTVSLSAPANAARYLAPATLAVSASVSGVGAIRAPFAPART